jgi:hypothetical protein
MVNAHLPHLALDTTQPSYHLCCHSNPIITAISKTNDTFAYRPTHILFMNYILLFVIFAGYHLYQRHRAHGLDTIRRLVNDSTTSSAAAAGQRRPTLARLPSSASFIGVTPRSLKFFLPLTLANCGII